MAVVNDTITTNAEEIEDDISETEEENKPITDETADETLAQLKTRLALKRHNNEEKVMPARIVEKRKRSLNFGVVGTGQSGSRIGSELYKLGYPTVAFNTAPQDLEQIKIPEANKYLLKYGIGGAAKDLDIGHAAADAHRDGINNLISTALDGTDVFLLCFSLGGGSGAGSHDVMIDILSTTGKPIVVISVLPMSTEDVQTKNNALQTLSNLAKLAQERIISNLIVVDNAKLEAIFSNVSHMQFFSVGNQAIVKALDAFNTYSVMSSMDKGLDSMEWAKLFTDGEGLCVYGEMTVSDYADDNTLIAQAVIENHENGLLASGFDLSQTKYAGLIIAANENVWNQIPRGAVEYARELIKENCPGHEAVFYGTYVDPSIDEDVVKIYSMFSGLGLPEGRVSQLRKDVESDQIKTKERVQARNMTLTLDTGKDKVVSKAEEVRQKIKKNQSKFSQNFGQGGKLDFRK
jgi:cell division GTPase FtsZ